MASYLKRFYNGINPETGPATALVSDEALHKHKTFCQAWAKKHYKTLTPAVTAPAEALAERSEDGHRHGGRGEGAGDPSRAHGARKAERRGRGRVPGRPPGGGARGAERRRAGPRAGLRRPEQARGMVLQGISAEGQKRYWVGQGC
jgi:hypothetical protein